MNYNWHNGWGGGSWVLMTIIMVVFGLTWFAVSLIRRRNHTSHLQTHATPPPPPPPLTPHEVLAERRGEFEPDDYHRRPDSLERSKSRSDQQV